MEGIHLVKDLIKEGDWMVSGDLKDAYYRCILKDAHSAGWACAECYPGMGNSCPCYGKCVA